MKTSIPPVLITIALVCFGLLPKAQAVVPAPDGGYPNLNTAEGQNALFSLTTGQWNTASGAFTLWRNTDGSYNTAVGTAALLSNVGSQNTGSGIENTAVGAAALLLNTTGSNNTGVGADALLNNTTGIDNTAVGTDALFSNTTGNGNTTNGAFALFNNTTGNANTANGAFALVSNRSGNSNTAVGTDALSNNTTGAANIALGNSAGSSVTTANNVICIGTDGNNVNNSCYIGHIFDSMVTASAVFVNSNGRLGTMTSSKRFKQDIKPMNNASEALYSLKPVSFRYKKEFDRAGTSQLGLVAEDVEKIAPELVVRDKDGKAYSVRYDQVNAMLLNEFLKEHGKVEKLEAALDTVKKCLNEQEARIQKVSAQLEASKPAPQVVHNP